MDEHATQPSEESNNFFVILIIRATHGNRVWIVAINSIPETELDSLILLTVFKIEIMTAGERNKI